MAVIVERVERYHIACNHPTCTRRFSGDEDETLVEVMEYAKEQGWQMISPYVQALCPDHGVAGV